MMLLEKYHAIAMEGKGYRILGKNDWYSSVCREVSERILNDKNGLVVRCPAVYGYDLKIGETDLMKFLVNREANCGGWNETAGNRYPLLVDEVAEALSFLICSVGEVDLCDWLYSVQATVMEHFKDTSLNLIMVVYIAKNTAVYQNKVDIIICQKPFNGSAVEQIQRQSPRKS